MASSKDTFEPKTFAARTFAVGAFRGVGVDVERPPIESLGRLTPLVVAPIRPIMNRQQTPLIVSLH